MFKYQINEDILNMFLDKTLNKTYRFDMGKIIENLPYPKVEITKILKFLTETDILFLEKEGEYHYSNNINQEQIEELMKQNADWIFIQILKGESNG